MSKLEMYCVTNKRLKFLESSNYNLSWVGLDKCPENYIKSSGKINIFQKKSITLSLLFIIGIGKLTRSKVR